jgi:uncharacterized protein (TIGR03437 family)
MNRRLLTLLMALPGALLAESITPSLGYTGAPTDHNGQDCSTCHNTYGGANTDPSGSLTVMVNDYIPGNTQTIRIIIQHPQAERWGFQMSIREVSDETQSAGLLAMVSSTDPDQVVCDDGSQFGAAPPCNTLQQFAEHKNAPFGAMGATFEFDVLWTPPSPEVGKLHVYVAAVAANGDGTPAGDRVYTVVKTLANAGTCSITGSVSLRNVGNAASFQPGFSSNALISIFGLGFEQAGLKRTAGLGDLVNNAFPTELGCVSVQVTGPGVPQPVLIPITYVQIDQINAQMPEFSGTGTVTLQVLLNPGQGNQIVSSPATLTTLQPFAPAFFMLGTSTSIAAQIAGTSTVVADPSVVAGGIPAKPGDLVTLYATGFGDTNPLVPAGQLAAGQSPLVNGVTVTIGTVTLQPSDVLYAGLTPGSISGLYQFNVRVPASTPNGEIPVTIQIGSVQTQSPAFIPVEQ